MDEYQFKLEAFSPETIPMHRLAHYMRLLAELFGEKESVHFVGVAPGSTVIAARVDYEAQSKVMERIQVARTPQDEDAPLGKTIKEINDSLREDNADGSLALGSAKIIEFPGKKISRPVVIPPFYRPTTIDGYLQRIGGRDETAHASIRDFEGREWNCVMDRITAIKIAGYLYETPISFKGEGRWQRNQNAQWDLLKFKVLECEIIASKSLIDSINELRSLTSESDCCPTVDYLLEERV